MATGDSRDIAAKSEKEFINGGQLLWSADVERDGTGIKI